MDWIWQPLQWYLFLFVLGIIFFPLVSRFFGSFFDHGYGLSKTIAILVLTYSVFLLSTLKLLAFTQFTLFLLTFGFGVCSFVLFFNRQNTSKKKGHERLNPPILSLIILEELLFLSAFLFLAFVRGQEPSIRGLEKFMDFGFMSSILRSDYFPPLDMWLSADPDHPQGYPINYYYFGHLSGALLIKLTSIPATVGYNLILATILGQAVTIVFSLVGSAVAIIQRYVLRWEYFNYAHMVIYGVIGSFIVNFAGNLHTIYLFTKGYPNESPIPFWEILSTYNPAKYWYPNATRFIPFTIHEFPSYSYVVADLHGHVFDIPFVLLTIAILFVTFTTFYKAAPGKPLFGLPISLQQWTIAVLLGFMTAVHYMTNAFDGPIYILLTSLVFFVLYRLSYTFFLSFSTLIASFILFSLPFSLFFAPFVSGVGVNCSPEFLAVYKKIGPFLFEKGNCQVSAWWMLFILWGFFWVSFLLLIAMHLLESRYGLISSFKKKIKEQFETLTRLDLFMGILFFFGTFLIIIPEFFYIKDIYPNHFRANTMFKMGYQAFMMMGIAATYTLYRTRLMVQPVNAIMKTVFLVFFFFTALYPFFAFPAYYGSLEKKPELDGATWMKTTYPEDLEIINYFNENVRGQPVVLEAQGDSYTDYERISSYTGLPTVAGWWVHEWLWRGSASVVGDRIPHIAAIYESDDIMQTMSYLRMYNVRYVVISSQERTKYPKLNEEKFQEYFQRVFTSTNRRGAVYQVNQY